MGCSVIHVDIWRHKILIEEFDLNKISKKPENIFVFLGFLLIFARRNLEYRHFIVWKG